MWIDYDVAKKDEICESDEGQLKGIFALVKTQIEFLVFILMNYLII